MGESREVINRGKRREGKWEKRDEEKRRGKAKGNITGVLQLKVEVQRNMRRKMKK